MVKRSLIPTCLPTLSICFSAPPSRYLSIPNHPFLTYSSPRYLHHRQKPILSPSITRLSDGSTARTIATTSSATKMSSTTDGAIETEDIQTRKLALRKEIRSKVRALSSDEITAQSEKVWEKLFALPEYQTAKSIGLFLSMPKNEIKTETALRHCVEHEKIIYVPQVGQNFESADMELLRVMDVRDDQSGTLFYQSWPKNKWGIPEPPPDMVQIAAQPGDIDLLVVPGLGFDRHGNRIGQGKGYYDRFIARISQGSKPKLVAVTLDCQLVESVPVSPLDRVMDMILTPSETIVVSKN